MKPRLLILKKAFVFYIRISTGIRLFGILIGILFLGESNGYCQPQKGFDLSKIYNTAIDKYLLHSPNSSGTIIYLEKPSFDAEYSFRVTEYNDCINLEIDFFKHSYGLQPVDHIIKYKNAEFEPEVSHSSVIVSKKFKRELQKMFSQTINSRLSYPTPPDMPVDGTTYLFRIQNKENAVWEVHQPIRGSMAFRAAEICSAIAFALKNNSFNERKALVAIKAARF